MGRIDSQLRHLFVIIGPTGCGKSTVARMLASSLDFPHIDGDEFYAESNLQKMSSGAPLTDQDRWDWLILLRHEAMRRLSNQRWGVVLSCTALKEKYRDVIRVAALENLDVVIRFNYLDADAETLLQRVGERQGHFMKANMVRQQLESLERPTNKETDTLTLDVKEGTEKTLVKALKTAKELLKPEINSI